MPKNHYFSFNVPSEIRLIEDLVVEAIGIHAVNAYWLPRKGTEDAIYGESTDRHFDEAYVLPFYVATAEGWGGERDIIARFGLEIREQLTLNLARRDFSNLLSEQPHLSDGTRTRPFEGDLIYFDLTIPDTDEYTQGTFMEINFVEHEEVFYQGGGLQMYELRCENFRYSQETFTTGITNIDQSFTDASQFTFTGNTMPDTPIADNQTIEDEGVSVLDLSEDSPFGDYS